MNCKDIKNLLVDYYYDEVSPPAKSEIGNHLKECNKCKAEWDEINKSLSEIKTDEPAMTDRFWQNYNAGVHAKIADKKTGLWSWIFRPAYVPAAAGLIILVIAFLGISRYQYIEEEKTFIAANYELVRDIDMFEEFEMFRDMEEIESIEEI